MNLSIGLLELDFYRYSHNNDKNFNNVFIDVLPVTVSWWEGSLFTLTRVHGSSKIDDFLFLMSLSYLVRDLFNRW